MHLNCLLVLLVIALVYINQYFPERSTDVVVAGVGAFAAITLACACKCLMKRGMHSY